MATNATSTAMPATHTSRAPRVPMAASTPSVPTPIPDVRTDHPHGSAGSRPVHDGLDARSVPADLAALAAPDLEEQTEGHERHRRRRADDPGRSHPPDRSWLGG